jgi:uncharacterized protein (DUF58 family)
VTAAVCGLALGQRDLVRIAVLLIAAPLLASLVVARARLTISCRREVRPERTVAGNPVTVQITLANQSLLATGSLMLEDALPQPMQQRARFTLDSLRGREQRSLAYRLPFTGRGHYQVGPLRMRMADPFGLVERTRSFRSLNAVVVRPMIDPLPQSQLPGAWDAAEQANSHSVGSQGADDASIREYRQGDDLRKVHWRSTARHGAMMVRQEERPWHARSTILLDTRAWAHRQTSGEAHPDRRETDSFEWAVSALGSIAVLLRSKGRSLGVVAGTVPSEVGNPENLLDALADLGPSLEPDLRSAVERAEAIGHDSTLFAILGQLDEGSLRLLTKNRRTPGSAIAFLLEVDSWAVPIATVPVATVPIATVPIATVPTGLPPVGTGEFERARVSLTRAGWRVVPVRRGDRLEDLWGGLVSSPLAEGGGAARIRTALLR